MGSPIKRLGSGSTVIAIALLGGVAGCSWNATEPAPVFLKDGMGDATPGSFMPAPRPERHVTVRAGQSLRGLARAHHVSERALIAANHLRPPYRLQTGQRLIVPGSGDSTIRTAALPPVTMVPMGQPATAPTIVGTGTGRSPEVIPLDDPAGAKLAVPAPVTPPRAAASAPVPEPRQSGEPSAAEAARAEAAKPEVARSQPSAAANTPSHGGRYGWPVRGRVLAGYGVSSGGAHNDGINIAAPRGAPVAAVDGGEVAYAGNELKGYGNLVLVKHPNGYITAYAHCDELMVKKGDKVSRGQVIAKVGTTGGVSEPQLHFELRHGKQPVDPKEFLSSAPSAALADKAPRG